MISILIIIGVLFYLFFHYQAPKMQSSQHPSPAKPTVDSTTDPTAEPATKPTTESTTESTPEPPANQPQQAIDFLDLDELMPAPTDDELRHTCLQTQLTQSGYLTGDMSYPSLIQLCKQALVLQQLPPFQADDEAELQTMINDGIDPQLRAMPAQPLTPKMLTLMTQRHQQNILDFFNPYLSKSAKTDSQLTPENPMAAAIRHSLLPNLSLAQLASFFHYHDNHWYPSVPADEYVLYISLLESITTNFTAQSADPVTYFATVYFTTRQLIIFGYRTDEISPQNLTINLADIAEVVPEKGKITLNLTDKPAISITDNVLDDYSLFEFENLVSLLSRVLHPVDDNQQLPKPFYLTASGHCYQLQTTTSYNQLNAQVEALFDHHVHLMADNLLATRAPAFCTQTLDDSQYFRNLLENDHQTWLQKTSTLFNLQEQYRTYFDPDDPALIWVEISDFNYQTPVSFFGPHSLQLVTESTDTLTAFLNTQPEAPSDETPLLSIQIPPFSPTFRVYYVAESQTLYLLLKDQQDAAELQAQLANESERHTFKQGLAKLTDQLQQQLLGPKSTITTVTVLASDAPTEYLFLMQLSYLASQQQALSPLVLMSLNG